MELPLPVVKGTHLSGLEPPRDAVEVEGMIAHTPSHCALFAGGRRLVGLTLDTCSVKNVVASFRALTNRGGMIGINIPQ